MSDGIRLAARIWLPEQSEANPVPGILEYIPYRKRDGTAHRDSVTHPYVAGHGYACVRVDLRGSGDSEGILTDEYIHQEQQDGLEVLQWIANQPWCTGSVGMMGISWGGFNALQIAAHRPPELKAIITVCSTDDRYADDIHHMGGCLLGDNLSWASTMFAYNSCPPDPELVGDRWKELWLERLQHSGLWLDTWLRHQRRDEYWKQGSICEDFSAITCPVFAVSGWADGYSNAVFRLLAHLKGPRKGLIGPWGHKYPHLGVPGPAIGFLQESLRWWDQWLKQIDTGIVEEPMFRGWMQESVPPTTYYEERPGRWIGEPTWPSSSIASQSYPLAVGRLANADEQISEQALSIQSPLSVGLFAGKWCSYAAGPDLAHDQREEDGGALVFDSAPLKETIEILGAPVVELDLQANKPIALVAVRLSDVAEDGKATRVTYGLLNLTHRNSNEHPEYLKPDERYRVRVQLNDTAQGFPLGHRLRLSISTSYWPLAWPPPEPVRLTVYTGVSRLSIPVRQPRTSDRQLRKFGEPEGAPPLATTLIEPERHNWRVIRDLAKDESTLEVVNDRGIVRLDDIDLEVQNNAVETYTYQADDFSSVRGETYWVRSFTRRDWSVKTITRTVLTSTPTHFHLRANLDAYEGDTRVYCTSWDQTIPRDYV
nr:CocE/NonD family hydrolase [Candidatus Nitrospira neomarina]